MGPIYWPAVGLAAVVAAFILRLSLPGPANRKDLFLLLQIVPAAMLGHALARIGPDKLAVKPQLYFMQAGGLALAIVIPALWMLGLRDGKGARELWRDSAAFLIAYLAMGGVFWVLS